MTYFNRQWRKHSKIGKSTAVQPTHPSITHHLKWSNHRMKYHLKIGEYTTNFIFTSKHTDTRIYYKNLCTIKHTTKCIVLTNLYYFVEYYWIHYRLLIVSNQLWEDVRRDRVECSMVPILAVRFENHAFWVWLIRREVSDHRMNWIHPSKHELDREIRMFLRPVRHLLTRQYLRI